MSQEEILAILEQRKNKWFNSNELSDITHLNRSCIRVELKRLREAKEVKYRDGIRFEGFKRLGYVYKHKA